MKKILKKRTKGLISLLLVLSVMASLLVPFDVTVFADEEPATGSDIHAFVYTALNADGSVIRYSGHEKYELIFQRGDTPPYPDREPLLHVENFDNDEKTNAALGIGGKESYKQPWYDYNYYVHRLIVKDKIAPRKMSGWFMYMKTLSDENVSGLEDKIDTRYCTSLYCAFNYCYLKNLDLTRWDVSNVTTVNGMFSHQDGKGLKTLNISNWEMPNCTNFGAFIYDSLLEELDLSALNPKKATTIASFLAENKKLKRVKFGNEFTVGLSNEISFISAFENDIALEELDLSSWNVSNARYFRYMFRNCSSLKSIDFGDNNWGSYSSGVEYTSMFEGCSSLETIKATSITHFLNHGAIFKNCTSLKSLDLSAVGTSYPNKTGFTLSGKDNIFEGCNELAWVKLNDKWPAKGNAGSSVPPKASWKKIEGAGGVAIGTVLPNTELFQNFNADYAGTWVSESIITFQGNGGTPRFQSTKGVLGDTVTFNESEIVAERNGYDFDGWWTEPNGGTQFHSGEIAGQWSYYAHWNEHKYNLILDGNGGTVPPDYSGLGTVSEDRTTITFENLNYSQFCELSKNMFTREGDYVLASWNTRKNGKGTAYYANDSVNKLTEADGATATLFAQWHKPEAVIRFDSDGGSEVDSREYNVGDKYGSLNEPYKVGYTFTGWYTEPNEQGVATRITADSEVIGSQTLHAIWQKNPAVTFNANGGKINGADETTKMCSYGYPIGALPVPDNGSATLKGWYTAQTGGTAINSSTTVTADTTYYAQWGWQPKFETNGGSFTVYPEDGYEIKDSHQYTITALPEVSKDHSTFVGWYFGDHKVSVEDTLDLSQANVIQAHWTDETKYTVTFKYNDGQTTDSSVKVYSGNPVGQLPAPQREGYNFEGWFDLNDTPYTYETTINSNVTLTAKWSEQNRTVTFDPRGGAMVDSNSIKVVEGKPLPYLPGANYLNEKGEIQYRFGGWYTEPKGQGELLTTGTLINEDRTYYAHWLNLKNQSDEDYVHSIHWATISNTEVTNTGGHLVFHPTVKGDINARLYISIEKPNGATLDLPANSLTVTIPRHLFESDSEKNNLAMFFNASDEDDLRAKYSDDGQSIILYNPSPITRNTILTPEFNISPLALKGGYIDDNGYYKGDYYQKNFNVTIDIKEIQQGETTVQARHYERAMGLEVHTSANTTVSKARADVSLNWNTDWGDAPVDAKEYFYVVWSLTSDNRNCNQPYQLKWSEDTIHDGTVVYSSPTLGEWAGPYTSDGTHTVKVVTKHRRADVHNEGTEWAKVTNEAILSVKWNNEYEQHFRATRTAEVYVPIEGTGNFTFAKNIPDYSDQNKHYINGGQELILNSEPEKMPLPFNIGYAENVNTDDTLSWNPAAGTYQTAPRTIVIEDGADGDVMLSTDYGSQFHTWESPYIKKLNQSDYYFTQLNISLTEYDAVFLDGKWSNAFENNAVENYGAVIVYAKTAGSDTLEVVTTLRGVNQATVTLPKNTVYFKVEHTSDYFTTRLKVDPTLYLTDSNRVRSLISDDVADKRDTIVMNKCRLSVTCNGNTEVTESSKDSAWRSMYLLNISSSTLYAAKNCCTTDAVWEESSTEEFPVVIGGWNYNNSSRGYSKYIKSGVFNDLLPKDCTVDKSTVFVCARTTNTTSFAPSSSIKNWANYYDPRPGIERILLPEGYFSVVFTDNWQDSGRTMMTVTVNSPDGKKYTGYDVFYKMKTTYSNINIYGINLINSVSFTDTTNGQSTPDLRSGTLSVLDALSKNYYNSIDSPQTAYATDKTNLKQPPKFQYGADSNVRAEGSVYSKHEVVGLNTEYNYNVCYTGGDTSKTDDIVIYDVLERQIDGPVSEWHGSFRSLDLSALKSLESATNSGKCNPVVYYSVKPKEEFTAEDLDITKSNIWTTTKPADNEITAIAIDCRTTDKNLPFVLDEKKSLSFNINMHSPASERQSELETYNEAVVDGKISDLNERIQSKARTGVTLRFVNPRFVKTAFPESGTEEKPESVVKGSVLEYVLKLTNPDQELEMTDIVVEDIFSNSMKFNNTIKVKLGNGDSIPVSQAARISSYSVAEDKENQKTVFTAAISFLAPGETIEITIPVTVTDDIGTKIDNKARVKSINGVEYNIESNETHHVVSKCQVKVLKVNGKGDPLAGAVLQILDENQNVVNLTNDGVNYVTQFTSTDEVIHFNLNPGSYYVHEVSAPDNYNTSADIPFTIDEEGIISVGNKDVSYVAVTDAPKYKVIFHENKYNGNDTEVQKEFRVYEPVELNADYSITHFYDIPEWAGDEYVFAGWYHDSGYTKIARASVNSSASIASNFEADKYPFRDGDYHLYAKWIKVGYVNKDETDDNIVSDNRYRGFGLAGVQIREPEMHDSNYGNEITPAGMRFITSISEDLLRQIDEVSDKQVTTEEGYSENVEYGYVAARKDSIDAFVNHYGAVPAEYTLQYRGENVNGVNTLGSNEAERTVKTDYRYISNINCTSSHPINGKPNGTPFVKDDHRNYGAYRLYTLVITYEGEGANQKGDSVDARAYIRYYDANGKLRVFYNNYNKTKYYGGCMCSYNQISDMALPKKPAEGEGTN